MTANAPHKLKFFWSCTSSYPHCTGLRGIQKVGNADVHAKKNICQKCAFATSISLSKSCGDLLFFSMFVPLASHSVKLEPLADVCEWIRGVHEKTRGSREGQTSKTIEYRRMM